MRTLRHIGMPALCSFLLAVAQPAMTQGKGPELNGLPEQLALYTDRSCYMAGESIAFVIQLGRSADQDAAGLSQFASLELVDARGQALARLKLSLSGGRATGRMAIPPHAGSTTYYLRAYTAWQRNWGPRAFTYLPVMVIHPRIPYAASGDSLGSFAPSAERMAEHGTPLLQGLGEAYSPGAVLRLGLDRGSGASGMLIHCLAVVARGSSLPVFSPWGMDIREQLPRLRGAKGEQLFLREEGGMILQGKVHQLPEDIPLEHELILLSPVDSSTRLLQSRSDERGHFHFHIPLPDGDRDHVIQPHHPVENVVLDLLPSFSLDSLPLASLPALPALTEEQLEAVFAELYLRQRLAEAYRDPASRAVSLPGQARGNVAGTPFYGKADHLILMDEYIQLPLMEEVFRELGKRVFLQGSGPGYEVRLLDLHSNRIIGQEPWFFLDGVPFFDSRILLEIPPASIHSIALKSEKYFLGSLIMDGIIDVKSRQGDAGILDLPRSVLRSYVRAPEMESAIHVSGQGPFSATSTFIPWPEQSLGSDGQLEFKAPVLEGDYDIVLQGLTPGGTPFHQRYPFRVELKP